MHTHTNKTDHPNESNLHAVAPVKQVCRDRPSAQNSAPVWVRVPDAVRLSGLCRSTIYSLISSGRIKSFSNKINRDCQRGTRLISYDSLVSYLEEAYAAAKEAS